jgi:two-component system sensor histidine kinase DegS
MSVITVEEPAQQGQRRTGSRRTIEETMSGAERLAELNSDALAIITGSETQIGDLERRVETLRAQLDTERRRLSAALDELSARFYENARADGAGAGNPLNLKSFRDAERDLSEQLMSCDGLASKLNGLSNLLTVSRNQFTPQGEDSPTVDVWRLVERIAMIKAQEEERSRLAREIHDGPAQVLANAILGLELCEQIARRSPEQLTDELARLKATMREGLLEVRRFQFDLRPSSLADRGLLLTLQRYINEYRTFFKLNVDLQLPDRLPTLNKDEELQTFRIIQEGLQNIQKHARATVVVVRLEANDEVLTATIQDNGRGFVPQQTESTLLSGAGLRGMGERAASVGGDLLVESRPGGGTTITFSLPRAVAVEEESRV